MMFFFRCLTGIRIQTTHAGTIKRKYTIWGVSEKSANRKQFDVTDERTGRTYKTTVADYFKDRYRLILRCELQMIYITFRTRPLSDLPPPCFFGGLCDKPYRYSWRLACKLWLIKIIQMKIEMILILADLLTER